MNAGLKKAYESFNKTLINNIEFYNINEFFKCYPNHFLKKYFNANEHYYDVNFKILYNTFSKVISFKNEDFYIIFNQKISLQHKIRYENTETIHNPKTENIEMALSLCFA